MFCSSVLSRRIELCPPPQKKYSQEFKERAIRLVDDRLCEDQSMAVTAVIVDIAPKLGISKETLRRWYSQEQVDVGCRSGITGEENAEIRHQIPG
ncbi:transposase [Arcanobacterium canis]